MDEKELFLRSCKRELVAHIHFGSKHFLNELLSTNKIYGETLRGK